MEVLSQKCQKFPTAAAIKTRHLNKYWLHLGLGEILFYLINTFLKINLMCVGVLPTYMPVYHIYAWVSWRHKIFLELELQMVVNHNVGTQNRT